MCVCPPQVRVIVLQPLFFRLSDQHGGWVCQLPDGTPSTHGNKIVFRKPTKEVQEEDDILVAMKENGQVQDPSGEADWLTQPMKPKLKQFGKKSKAGGSKKQARSAAVVKEAAAPTAVLDSTATPVAKRSSGARPTPPHGHSSPQLGASAGIFFAESSPHTALAEANEFSGPACGSAAPLGDEPGEVEAPAAEIAAPPLLAAPVTLYPNRGAEASPPPSARVAVFAPSACLGHVTGRDHQESVTRLQVGNEHTRRSFSWS